MLKYKIYFLLKLKKFMGINNNIICCYDLKTNKYEFYYVDGLNVTYLNTYDNRLQAKFALYILSD